MTRKLQSMKSCTSEKKLQGLTSTDFYCLDSVFCVQLLSIYGSIYLSSNVVNEELERDIS